MNNYKITCTIVINTEAKNEDEALEIAQDCANYTDADWYVREVRDDADKIKLVWGEERTEEILNYWLGDAANEQARMNLFDECKYDEDVLEDVQGHWESAQ